MKNRIFLFALFILLNSLVKAQEWSNSSAIYFIANKDSLRDTLSFSYQSKYNYNSIISNKVYTIDYYGWVIYGNTNLSQFEKKTGDFSPRFLYRASNDTLYHLRVQAFGTMNEYFVENDTAINRVITTDIANNYNKMWMGSYYIYAEIKDSFNLRIYNRQHQLVDKETYVFENNDWLNTYYYLFLNGGYGLFADSSSLPNYRIQYFNDHSIIFSFALHDTLGNLPTLYSYKISYEDSSFNVRMITKFENFPLLTSFEFASNQFRFIFNDISYTQGLDTMIISVINNRTDSIHLPIGNFGYTIPPLIDGQYVFSLNQPDALLNLEKTMSFKIFPNPNNGYFTIRNKKEKIVFDCLGKEILKTFDEEIYLPKGFYFVRVGAVVAKVIVE